MSQRNIGNSLNLVLKKMDTKTLSTFGCTSRNSRNKIKPELKKRTDAAKKIQKAVRQSQVRRILNNGIELVDNMVQANYFPKNIEKNLVNDFLIQFPITNRQESLILKELIQHMLEKLYNRKTRTKKQSMNYILNTSSNYAHNNRLNWVEAYYRAI